MPKKIIKISIYILKHYLLKHLYFWKLLNKNFNLYFKTLFTTYNIYLYQYFQLYRFYCCPVVIYTDQYSQRSIIESKLDNSIFLSLFCYKKREKVIGAYRTFDLEDEIQNNEGKFTKPCPTWFIKKKPKV